MSKFNFTLVRIQENQSTGEKQYDIFDGAVEIFDSDGKRVASQDPVNEELQINSAANGNFYVSGLPTGEYTVHTNGSADPTLTDVPHAGEDLLDFLKDYEGEQTTLAGILNSFKAQIGEALTSVSIKTDYSGAVSGDILSKSAIIALVNSLGLDQSTDISTLVDTISLIDVDISNINQRLSDILESITGQKSISVSGTTLVGLNTGSSGVLEGQGSQQWKPINTLYTQIKSTVKLTVWFQASAAANDSTVAIFIYIDGETNPTLATRKQVGTANVRDSAEFSISREIGTHDIEVVFEADTGDINVTKVSVIVS